ncbi:ATP-dependent RNA helicase RhlB [Spirochaetia bacterium]|nr:ATP-dependent RNA helicase RhlB [Spirochaetia bacterium]
MEFTEFKLHEDLQKGIAEAGYQTCMTVQAQVLQAAFGGQDLYVQSQTGTGKTAAYLIVIFQRLLTEPLLHGKKAIIMVPTRELAVQVEEEAKVLGKYLPFVTGSFYGGVGYSQQQQTLRDNAQILVGTPGRVLDLNSSGQMNLMDIAFMVLDEADRMFDMGFYPDLRKLIKVVPPVDRRQTMLFSATLNAWVKNLAWEYTKSPVEIEIEPETVTVAEIQQLVYHVSSSDKMKLLLGILERERPESAIVFCNTKHYTEIIAKRLKSHGHNCDYIIGDLIQSKRLKIIEDFKAGKLKYLAATDVAARGLDIEGLSMVINYDLPSETENYVHRIGRTARAGKSGKAITLASEQDVYALPAIEKYIGKKIPSETATAELFARRTYSNVFEGGERVERDKRRSSRGERPRERPERPVKESRIRGERKPNPAAVTISEEELSKLSFDERMAYYKQKYESPVTQSKPKNNADKQKSSRRKRGSPRQGGEAVIIEESNPNVRDYDKQQETREKVIAPVNPEINETVAPAQAKPGLFSRLFAAFKSPKADKE